MQTKNMPTLQIHKLTKEQYNMALAEGNVDETALYFTPDEGADLQVYKLTQEQYDTALAEGNVDETALYFTPDEGADLNTLMSATNPEGTGSFSMNRLADSTVGDYSSTLGLNNAAPGECAHAEGNCTTADAYQHVQGCFNTLSSGGSSAGGTSGSAFVIGNGTSSAASNAFRVS